MDDQALGATDVVGHQTVGGGGEAGRGLWRQMESPRDGVSVAIVTHLG